MCVVQESSRIMKMKALLDEGMIGWLFVLAIVLSGVFALHYYLYTRRYYQLARKIPGPPGWPIIGHTFNFLRGTEEAFHNIWNSVGSSEVCKLWLATRLYTFIRNPADVELVLGSRVHLHKFVESNFFESWLDDGLNVVSGCKWKAYRRLMTPFLQSGQIFEQILTLNKIMENKNLNSSGKELDCYSYMSDAVMELLLVSTFGENIDKDESRQYSQAIQKLRKIIRHRQNKFWLYPDYIFKLSKHAKSQEDLLKIVHHFTRKAVKKRKEALMKQGYGLLKSRNFFEGALKCHNESECLKKPTTVPCILDLMMGVTHNGMALMDTEVQNQVNAIMLEGHDATALTGSIFLGVLADRPDIQEKCVAELNDIFGDSQRPVTFNDISEMKYLERCLMETLRMNPPVPFISRKLEEDLRLASTSLTIPENSIVVIDVRKLQMNEEIYSKPDIFDPHNFIKEKCVSRHYFSFIPFSAGPRNCIGMKYSIFCLKVLISSVLRKYKILPSKGGENATMKPRNMTSSDRFIIELENRK